MASPPSVAVSERLGAIRAAVASGLLDAAQDIRARAVKKTPVDTGNLRKSAEIFIDGSNASVPHATELTRKLSVRYSAPYAGHVHNASGKGRGRPRSKPHRGKYWDPAGSTPKFLQKAADEVFPRVTTYIQRRIREVSK